MKTVFSAIIFILLLIPCGIGSWYGLGIRKKVSVQNVSEVPFMQAVILTNDGPEFILGQEAIEEFLSTRKDATFLLPPQDRQEIQARVNESLKNSDTGVSLQVEPIINGRQQVEVFMHGDPSDYILGYEATAREIFPKYYRRFNVFDAMAVTAVTLIATSIIHQVIKRYIKKRTNRVIVSH